MEKSRTLLSQRSSGLNNDDEDGLSGSSDHLPSSLLDAWLGQKIARGLRREG